LAAERGKFESLHKLWEWVKEKLTTEEISNKLFLGTDNKAMTDWHWAAERHYIKYGSGLKRN
jgi:hypothetical protein